MNLLCFPDQPLVSVIIPAYNASKFIEKTIKSVINQTYQNWEMIVVDDGSHDETANIVLSFTAQDQRIRLLRQPNAGVAVARNLAINHSQGKFIAPIDADDIWYPGNLEKQVNCIMTGGEKVGLVYAWSVDINENDQLTGGYHVSNYEGKIYPILVYYDFLGNASATVIRRCCLDQVGVYNTKLREQEAQGCEDWDLYLRIAEHYEIRVVPEFLIGYRQMTNSMSRNYESMVKSYQLVLQNVQSHNPGIPKNIYNWSLSNFYIYLAYQSYNYGDYKISCYWLYQAWLLDPSMTTLRYEFYMINIKNILQLIFPKRNNQTDNQQTISNKENYNESFYLKKIHQSIKIGEFMPRRVYETIRIKWLYWQL